MAMAVDEEVDTGMGLEFPYWKATRRRFSSDSAFYVSGNIERELLAKQFALDLTDDEKHALISDDDREILCPIAGCGSRLTSVDSFEDHYKARHTASCSLCSRVYPTSRLLSIHVSEAHDSFFQAKVARGHPMYECLVEGCDLKFKNYKGRKQHLVDKHKFPVSFEFLKKPHPSKKARQKHLYKGTACRKETSMKMEVEDESIENLASAISKLTTSHSAPSSISFGHRRSRGISLVPRVFLDERNRQYFQSALRGDIIKARSKPQKRLRSRAFTARLSALSLQSEVLPLPGTIAIGVLRLFFFWINTYLLSVRTILLELDNAIN